MAAPRSIDELKEKAREAIQLHEAGALSDEEFSQIADRLQELKVKLKSEPTTATAPTESVATDAPPTADQPIPEGFARAEDRPRGAGSPLDLPIPQRFRERARRAVERAAQREDPFIVTRGTENVQEAVSQHARNTNTNPAVIEQALRTGDFSQLQDPIHDSLRSLRIVATQSGEEAIQTTSGTAAFLQSLGQGVASGTLRSFSRTARDAPVFAPEVEQEAKQAFGTEGFEELESQAAAEDMAGAAAPLALLPSGALQLGRAAGVTGRITSPAIGGLIEAGAIEGVTQTGDAIINPDVPISERLTEAALATAAGGVGGALLGIAGARIANKVGVEEAVNDVARRKLINSELSDLRARGFAFTSRKAKREFVDNLVDKVKLESDLALIEAEFKQLRTIDEANTLLRELPEGGIIQAKAEDVAARLPFGGAAVSKIGEGVGIAKEGIEDFLRKAFDGHYIRSFGKQGQAAAELIEQQEKATSLAVGRRLEKVWPFIQKLTKDERLQVTRLLRGRIKPNTVAPHVKEAADQARAVYDDILADGIAVGVETMDPDGTLRPLTGKANFVNQVLNSKGEKLLKTPRQQQMIDAIAKENGISKAKAAELVKKDFANKASRRHNSLEFARSYNLPEHLTENDIGKLLVNYVAGATDRIEKIRHWGKQGGKLKAVARGATAEVGQFSKMNELSKLLDAVINPAQTSSAVRALRNYQVISKMGFSALTNLGDFAKIAAQTDILSTLKGLKQAFSKEGQLLAIRSGNHPKAIMAVAEQVGEQDVAAKFLRKVGFSTSEEKIRQTTILAARQFAEKTTENLHQQFLRSGGKIPDNLPAVRRLMQMTGFDPDAVINAIKTGKLSEDTLTKVGLNVLREGQPLSALDVSYYANKNQWVRLSLQFKSFAIKHTRFMIKYVASEARHGNWAPAVRFALVAQATGFLPGTIKRVLQGRAPEGDDGFVRQVARNLVDVGGLGLITDASRAAQFNDSGGLLAMLVGPTISDLADFGDAAFKIAEGDLGPAGKVVNRKVLVPLIGAAAPKTSTLIRPGERAIEGTLFQTREERGRTKSLRTRAKKKPKTRREKIKEKLRKRKSN